MADNSVESNSAKVLLSMKEAYKSPVKRLPARIRKKNQRFFNEDEDTSYSPTKSPRKITKPARFRSYISGPDKRAAQMIGVKLRNLLKLPKAHKWVCYEWFYSNLDVPLFKAENDFCVCLKESFPQLKARKLKAVEWCKIRRLMGKPRRCSASFFDEERALLHEKRQKIRLLQQRKMTELSSYKDIPEEIPLHLVIGTKVTARLRKPQDGLFTGTIDALDTVNNSYRITFDRPGLGTHSVPDYEVLRLLLSADYLCKQFGSRSGPTACRSCSGSKTLDTLIVFLKSNDVTETIPISAFQQKQRPRVVGNSLMSPPRFIPSTVSSNPDLNFENDPLLSGAPFRGHLMSLEGGTYGGFPIKFLVLVTRLSKILTIKKDWITQLKDMNTEAEKRKSYQQPIAPEFQKKYANIVLELENLNKDLNEYLIGVQQYCQELAPEQGLKPIDQPSEIRQKCDEEGESLVAKVSKNMFANKMPKNDSLMMLIEKLTSLMLQIRVGATFSENELNSFEYKSLQDAMNEIKETLDRNNINSFKNNVEIHINHIQSGLSQMGNLHAFSSTNFTV